MASGLGPEIMRVQIPHPRPILRHLFYNLRRPTHMSTTRNILISFCVVLLSSALILAALSVVDVVRSPTVEHNVPGLSPSQTAFLQVCTGLDVSTGNEHVAVSNCLGRLRGLVDGHAITVQLAAAVERDIALWCVDTSVSDKQLLDATLLWYQQNADRVANFTTQYSDPALIRTAVFIAALHAYFPCER